MLVRSDERVKSKEVTIMNGKSRTILLAALALMSFPVLAHHSFYAEFDSNKEVELDGEVVKMEWVNPHSWLNIKVINEQGQEEIWRVEGGSPGVLLRLGWTRDSLPPGARVRVKGFLAKDGSFRMNSRGIEFPDGRTLETGGSRQ